MEKFHLDFEKTNLADAQKWFHSRWHTMQADALENVIKAYYEHEQETAESVEIAFKELVTFSEELGQLVD